MLQTSQDASTPAARLRNDLVILPSQSDVLIEPLPRTRASSRSGVGFQISARRASVRRDWKLPPALQLEPEEPRLGDTLHPLAHESMAVSLVRDEARLHFCLALWTDGVSLSHGCSSRRR